jgi:hypothetical protein
LAGALKELEGANVTVDPVAACYFAAGDGPPRSRQVVSVPPGSHLLVQQETAVGLTANHHNPQEEASSGRKPKLVVSND